jgi:erythromycin esterase-like protein
MRNTCVLGIFLMACSSNIPAAPSVTNAPDAAPADAGTSDTSLAPADASPADAAPDAKVPVALAPGLYPLASNDPEVQGDDLVALNPVLAQAEIVGIGESVHTTGGQYAMRIRVLRHMIEKLGFRALAFESPWQNIIQDMGPYARTCVGDPESAAKSLNPVWWDKSVPTFMTWLCQWNQAHPTDQVAVYGVDIRQPWHDLPAYRSYITTRDPSGGAARADGLNTCLGVGFPSEQAFFADPTVRGYYAGKPTPVAPHTACQSGAKAALENLTAERAAYLAAAGEEAWDFARLAVVQLGAFDELMYQLSRVRVETDLKRANQPRDVAMFDAFQTLYKYRFSGRKTALWAHNDHLTRAANKIANSQWTGVQSLGTSLSETYGSKYAVVGQVSLLTKTAFMGRVVTEPMSAMNSFEGRISALPNNYVLALLPDATLAEAGGMPIIPPGPISLGLPPKTIVPAEQYDAIIWHRRSDEMTYFAMPQ